jgi:hypothetical protein
MPKRYPAALLALLLSACASMNDALHPSTQVLKDDFDGTLVVRQQPVSAANGIREPWHTLGFEWSQKSPDTVLLTVAAHGAGNISDIAFNADGRIYDNVKVVNPASGRFAVPWSTFLALAEAGSVKMKVERLDQYTVSSFGPKHPGAAVNSRIPTFVTTVREVRAGNKNPLAKLDKKKKDAKPVRK